jgi:hypothetical protein
LLRFLGFIRINSASGRRAWRIGFRVNDGTSPMSRHCLPFSQTGRRPRAAGSSHTGSDPNLEHFQDGARVESRTVKTLKPWSRNCGRHPPRRAGSCRYRSFIRGASRRGRPLR